LNAVQAAGSPVWTLTPLTATTLTVPSNDTAMVQYQVTNQSTTARTLSMQSIPGVTQVTTGQGVCGSPFVLTGKGSCTLSLEINGSQLTRPIMDGPVVCENSSKFLCYRPARGNNLHVTPVDASVILTSVSPAYGEASGGTGVTLTGVGLTGTTGMTFGGVAATNVNVVDSTTVTAVTPAHAVGAVDVVISTSAGDASLVNGYTYTEIGQIIGGGTVACLNGESNDLIAALADNSTSRVWGNYGVSTGATSNTDGATNTDTIVNTPNIGASAAQVCASYAIDSQGNTPCQLGNICYDDWFLPAGNNTESSGQLNCLYVNQVKIGGFSTGYYWSSTESVTSPSKSAWSQFFNSGSQFSNDKDLSVHVRCVRPFSPGLITMTTPNVGPEAGETGFKIIGTGLTGATAITFDGVPATSFNAVDATTVTAVTPAHAVGTVDIVISTPTGDTTLTDGYTYVTNAAGLPSGGGVIGCLNEEANNNLIAATANNILSIQWGSFGVLTGATSNTDGVTNTNTIVNTPGIGESAAQVCASYTVDSQGNTPCQLGNTCYGDWFLPAGNNTEASGQLNCLFENKTAIKGFRKTFYWSSTESNDEAAWLQSFRHGSQRLSNKDAQDSVRCVRVFTP